jgi:anti-sigma factor RsiW
MKDFDENELIDKAMAGQLDAKERQLWEALLAERPELEAELAIGRALREMPKPPAVSSNFTALVLQEINRADGKKASRWNFNWLNWPMLVRAGGVAVVVLGIGVQVAHQRRVEKQAVAQTVRSFAGGLNVVAAKPEAQPERVITLVKDFEAIRNLPAPGNVDSRDVDSRLLAAMRLGE